MAKVKIISDHLSGKGTKIWVDGVEVQKATGLKLTAGVGEVVRFEVSTLCEESSPVGAERARGMVVEAAAARQARDRRAASALHMVVLGARIG